MLSVWWRVAFLVTATIGWCHGEPLDGYSPFLDSEVEKQQPALGEVAMVNREEGFECPSPNVITTRYRCKVK